MPPSPLPDCPWCRAASTLLVTWAEMGTEFCECSCCSQLCRVINGLAYKGEPRRSLPRERRRASAIPSQ